MSEHRTFPPAFLAQIDQMRAETEAQVLALADDFRRHADECHGGDPVCSDALISMRLLQRGRWTTVSVAAGAVGLIVKLQAEVAELRAELGR